MTKGRHRKRRKDDDSEWIFDGVRFVEAEYEYEEYAPEWLNWVYGIAIFAILFTIVAFFLWGGLIIG